MLGPPKPRRLDEPIVVALEEFVPSDSFYCYPPAVLAAPSANPLI